MAPDRSAQETLRNVIRLLTAKNLRVATAESCTCGMLAEMLTDESGASAFYNGGVICYNNTMKNQLLGVDATLLEEKGAVCGEVAFQLADKVRLLTKSDIGIGVTGMAGPTSDEDGKPVGLIYVTVTDGKNTFARTLNTGINGKDCRNLNRHAAVRTAFELLEEYCLQEGDNA